MSKICSECGFRVPSLAEIEEARQIPCSSAHIRCERCKWPVAKTLISGDGLCYYCMDGYARRKYNRRNGRMLYGEADGSTDPKDYLMHGRMTFHGDEEQLLNKRRARKVRVAPIDPDRLEKQICQLPHCSNPIRTPGARYCCHPHSLEHRWQWTKQEGNSQHANVTESTH